MSKLPSIPIEGTDKNVKLAIDSLAGRMDVMNKAITVNDLVSMGIISAEGAKILQSLPPSFGQEDIVFPEIPEGFLPELPTTPSGLTTSSSWGAIHLQWNYVVYNAEYGTEIHRSHINDRNTAVLIAVSTGRSYSDNVGKKETFYYWVRNRNIEGSVSGFNQLQGVQGQSDMILTVEDLALANPNVDFVTQPFSIIDLNGGIGTPNWVLVLNGQTLIQSDLSIGQLVSGEMRPNTTFTIGNGSMVISTNSSGVGEILVTGDGGTNGNDFLRITNGTIYSEVWVNGQHEPYKELRRQESGSVNIPKNSGEQSVEIPGYWKEVPTVSVYPKNISVYNTEYTDQSQQLVLDVTHVYPVAGKTNHFAFTVAAGLILSGGIASRVDNLTQTGSAEWTNIASAYHDVKGAISFSVKCKITSVRAQSVTEYRRRKSTFKAFYRVANSANAWTLGALQTLPHGDSLAPIDFSVSFSVPLGNWEILYQRQSQDNSTDTTDTFPKTGDTYQYAELTSTAGSLFTIENTVASLSSSALVKNTRPTKPGWELYKVDYEFSYTWVWEHWYVKYDKCTDAFPLYYRGTSSISIPVAVSSSSGTSGYSVATQTYTCDAFPPASSNAYNTKSGSGTFKQTYSVTSANRAMLERGEYTAENCSVNGSKILNGCVGSQVGSPACDVGAGRGRISITAYKCRYYYRLANIADTTPVNTLTVGSYDANLGAQTINIDDTVINYIATGN